MSKPRELHLFDGYGVELEYMLVSQDTLEVAPASDQLILAEAGEITGEYAARQMGWNNELVLHVIEFKTDGPQGQLAGLAERFHREVQIANKHLSGMGKQLLPTAMHPWMSPANDTQLWPHEANEIYAGFDRIFSCQGHGWSNLQSVHLNLPFCGDEEFRRLHSSIRPLLPLIPMLAASSPALDGKVTGRLDNRLFAYRENCARIPSITGLVVPDVYRSQREYHDLLESIYRDLLPHDPDGVLQEEWVNARGVIVRFDRMAMEIRVTDIQECPAMDLAMLEVMVATLKSLVEERWSTLAQLESLPTNMLAKLLEAAARDGEQAGSDDQKLLTTFGWSKRSASGAQLWRHLAEDADSRGLLSSEAAKNFEVYLAHGTLARRISHALGNEPDKATLQRVYRGLCDNLAENRPYAG